jgi:hypothetical protein
LSFEISTLAPAVSADQRAVPKSKLRLAPARPAIRMRAGEIAPLVDATYQLIGHRTSKLHEMGLVYKTSQEGVTRSTITDKTRQRYFGMAGQPSGLKDDD